MVRNLRKLKRWLPVFISALLVAWILSRVSLPELGRAFAAVNWMAMAPLTVVYVLVIYTWESACLAYLFKSETPPLSWSEALRARGSAYVASVVNYGAGQGVLAWLVAAGGRRSYLHSLMLCALLTYTDLALLLALGAIGGWLSPRPQDRWIAMGCLTALTVMIVAALLAQRTPPRVRRAIEGRRWGAWLKQWRWSWNRMAILAMMRAAQFGVVFAYIVVGLSICHNEISLLVLTSVIPLTLLCDGLPISVAGLGTRETVLVALLRPSRPETLVAFTLIWTVGSIVLRAVIGLTNVWLFGLPQTNGLPQTDLGLPGPQEKQ